MSLRDIANEMIAEKDEKPVKRSKHTIYVNDAQYAEFIKVCERFNKKPSEIIDRLIASYLDELASILPPDEKKTA